MLTTAERDTLKDIAKEITRECEKVNAEGAHRYAGLVRAQMDIIFADSGTPEELHTATLQYYKFWGELKGFIKRILDKTSRFPTIFKSLAR